MESLRQVRRSLLCLIMVFIITLLLICSFIWLFRSSNNQLLKLQRCLPQTHHPTCSHLRAHSLSFISFLLCLGLERPCGLSFLKCWTLSWRIPLCANAKQSNNVFPKHSPLTQVCVPSASIRSKSKDFKMQNKRQCASLCHSVFVSVHML